MAREFALRERHLGEPFETVSRAEQRDEIATDHYFGGVRIPDHAGLHPGLYHQGLLDAARGCGRRGLRLHAGTGLPQGGGGLHGLPEGSQGPGARAGRSPPMAMAGGEFPWLHRRIMPFHAYQAVSAPLGENRVRSLLPGDRTFIDWNFNVDWMRIAPGDDTRIVFGGLTGEIDADLRVMGERLHQRLLQGVPRPGRSRIRPCVDRKMRRHLRHHAAHRLP